MSRQETNRQRSSVFEIAVSVVVIVTALVFAIPLVNRTIENFEKTTVQQIVEQLNSSAQFKLAEAVALDKLQQLPQNLRDNPLNWIDTEDLAGWDDYWGEIERVDFDKLDRGKWQFEITTGRLVYKLKYPDLVINNDPIRDRLQFRFKVEYVDYNNNAQFDKNIDTVSGLHVESVYKYRWIKGL